MDGVQYCVLEFSSILPVFHNNTCRRRQSALRNFDWSYVRSGPKSVMLGSSRRFPLTPKNPTIYIHRATPDFLRMRWRLAVGEALSMGASLTAPNSALREA